VSDDLLDRAARALREGTESQAEGNQFARARVLASLHQARVRRHKRFVFMAPFGLVFAAASAWGMASGRAPELARQVAAALGLVSAPEPKLATPRAQLPPPEPRLAEPAIAAAETATAAAETAPAAAETAEPPRAEAPLPAPAVVHAPASRSRSTHRREVAPRARPTDDLPSVDDPGHELYRAAHRAHFVERNPERALRGWDEYLAQARGGRFALEARYNRALCLIRLERNAEAQSALEPFARGDFGAYRRDEATRLLRALAQSERAAK
jgi:hypothetical protein